MRRPPTHPVLLLAIALCACGTRGPLFLPPPMQAKPATAPATTPAATANDLNTAKDPAR